MENISYITDENGEKQALVINLKPKSKITPEYLEDIEDILHFELLKNEETLDFDEGIEDILKNK